MGDSGRHAAAAGGSRRHRRARGGWGITILALAFALGVALGWRQTSALAWPWLILGAAGAFGVILLRARGRLAVLACIAVVALSFGASWTIVRQARTSPDDLFTRLDDDRPRLVHVRGMALQAPRLRDRSEGPMALFEYRAPASHFRLRIDALIDRNGRAHRVHGDVAIRVDEPVPPFGAGDRLELRGYLRRAGPPRNPGVFDFQRHARSVGQAGVLSVRRRDLLKIEPTAQPPALAAWLINARDRLRARAGGWLLSNLPDTGRAQREALLTALLLGRREAELDGIDESFRRVGLAHLLAISGLHLGVLAGFVLFTARLGGRHRRWHGLLVIGVVLLYLVLVELRMPVLRAGIMIIAGSCGLVFGRRLRVGGLVALSAIGLLLFRPDQLFAPGFQLSYGVVLGIVHLAPGLRARWFGPPNHLSGSTPAMIADWLKTSFVVAFVAWAISTPITAYHFSMISPLAAPLSVLAIPIVAVLLVVGFLKMILAGLLPSAALLLGLPLSALAGLLVTVVGIIDNVPGSFVRVPPASLLWSCAALAWICIMLGARPRRGEERRWWAAGAILVIWLLWPALPLPRGPALRIDMLAVGDGTCLIVRSGRSTVLFDAGSGNDLDAGHSLIVPALRGLGVTSIDAIVISHANLDHYAAVPDIVEHYGVDEVIVSPQFRRRAADDPLGAPAFLLENLARQGAEVVETSAGDVRTFGHSDWTWLHPPADAHFERINDSSIVIRVEAAGRRALLTGDLQPEAIEMLLLRAHEDADDHLAADIIELPHHGSYNDAAVSLLDRVDPGIVLQSTGWRRYERDRWAPHLAGRRRLVTARDGACTVVVDRSGVIETHRFLEAGGDAVGSTLATVDPP